MKRLLIIALLPACSAVENATLTDCASGLGAVVALPFRAVGVLVGGNPTIDRTKKRTP